MVVAGCWTDRDVGSEMRCASGGGVIAAARGLVGGGLIGADPCHAPELKPKNQLAQLSSGQLGVE
jgi:hypothetical protein